MELLALNLARLHPLLVHLPIGILLLVAVMEGLQRWQKHEAYRSAIRLGLILGTLGAVLSIATGWALGNEGGYGKELLYQHRWFGVGVAVASVFALIGHMEATSWLKRIYPYMLILLVLGISWTGHLGGGLTHGTDYLFSQPQRTERVADLKGAEVFPVVIQPILDQKCVSCHKESKSKGDLLLTNLEAFQAGGKTGSLIDADSSTNSLLWERIHLPMNHDDHMPPEGKPQLTRGEMAILSWWIEEGACTDCTVGDVPNREGVDAWLDAYRAGEGEGFDLPVPADRKIARLESRGIRVLQYAEDSPWISVDMARKETIDKKDLRALRALKEHIRDLDASFSGLTDRQAAQLANFPNLLRLFLQGTQVSDEGVSSLSKLEHLETLNLYATEITAQSLPVLAGIPSLRKLYLWQTDVPSDLVAEVQEDHPGLSINQAAATDSIFGRAALNPPVLAAESILIQDAVTVRLKSNLEGVRAYYTLDGSDPDTTDAVFPDSLVLSESAILKVFQTKAGWDPSPIVTREYLKGGIPIAQATLQAEPSGKYQGQGAKSLMDYEKGTISFTDGEWLGFEGKHMTVRLDLGAKQQVSSVSVSALSAPGSWIFYPKGLRVRGDAASIAQETWPSVDQEIANAEMQFFTLSFDPVETRYLDLEVISPLRNPDWHANPGGKSWIFIDEVLVN